MTDLGLFDRRDDDTGNVDLDELRAALAQAANTPAEPAATIPPPRRAARERRVAQVRRRRRRRRHTVAALVVLLILAGAITAGFLFWRHREAVVADYSGPPGGQVIVHVQDADSRSDVAGRLQTAGVVASTQAFLNATVSDGDVAKIQSGYYRLPTHLSAAAAANALVDPTNRVGALRIVPGRTLADPAVKPGATPVQGYLAAITAAACVPIDGVSHCFSAADLETVAETADPTALNVPDWAVAAVTAAPDPTRRLEGMIRPGNYNVPPTDDAQEALASVLSQSSALWSTSDVVAGAKALGVSPYQAAVIASLVEREGNAPNMSKVAEVIYNRLGNRMKLQLDSTVNYAFGRTDLATTDKDRSTTNPYNTYLIAALPPTPVDSPSDAAVAATLAPTDGTWLYFVITDKNGTTCFSDTDKEHEACVATARKNGVFG